jgi:hypothetical protein
MPPGEKRLPPRLGALPHAALVSKPTLAPRAPVGPPWVLLYPSVVSTPVD